MKDLAVRWKGIPVTDLLDGVRAGNIRAGDGAMGTMLQSAGLNDGGAPELWNVDRPKEIERILAGYADAGAQLLTTNTFGGSRPRLLMHGLEDRVHELNKAAAQIARMPARGPGQLAARLRASARRPRLPGPPCALV